MAADGTVTASPWNIANAITMARIAMVPLFIWVFLMDGVAARVWATVIFVVAALTDRVDGHLARSRGLITDLGKILDPIADKSLVVAALVLLSVDGLVPWWVTVVIIVRELGITVMRFLMIRRAVMAASKGGKVKTTLQMAFILGMLIPWAALVPSPASTVLETATIVIMYLALAWTVVTGLQYVADARRLRRRAA